MKSNFRDRTVFPGTDFGTTRRVPGSRKVSTLGFLFCFCGVYWVVKEVLGFRTENENKIFSPHIIMAQWACLYP
jgi:hypothetical protein